MEAVNTKLLVEVRAEKAPRKVLEIFRDLSAIKCNSVECSDVFLFDEVVFCKHALGSNFAGDCLDFSYHIFLNGGLASARHTLGSLFSSQDSPFFFSQYHVFWSGENGNQKHALGSWFCCLSPFFFFSNSQKGGRLENEKLE